MGRAIEQVAAISMETAPSAEEVSAAAEEVTAAAHQMNESIRSFHEMAAHLGGLVGLFRLDEEQPTAPLG